MTKVIGTGIMAMTWLILLLPMTSLSRVSVFHPFEAQNVVPLEHAANVEMSSM